MVTPEDLCWRDSETMTRVDVRIFDIERKAALAAAAADDSEGILAHAACAIAQYRGELLPGMYDDWLLDARRSLSASAWTCAIFFVRHERDGVT